LLEDLAKQGLVPTLQANLEKKDISRIPKPTSKKKWIWFAIVGNGKANGKTPIKALLNAKKIDELKKAGKYHEDPVVGWPWQR
jgi:hypothetical protein